MSVRYRTGLFTLLAFAGGAFGDSPKEGKGFIFYESFQGSANAIGLVSKLDTAGGYNFNEHFGVSVGIPFYFVRPTAAITSFTGGTARNGIGNVYASLRFAASHRVVNFASVLTGTAPTGDKARGFSTGRPTYDWTNHFNRTFSRVTPFANVGIANTISDTPFFIRPFSSLGFVGHFEGGADCRIAPAVSVGASAYKIAPSGEQRIISRVGERGISGAGAPGRGSGRTRAGRRIPFEASFETVGAAGLASDHGFSTWLDITPASFLLFEVGYSRSAPFALDTLFFGASLNIGSVARMARGR